MSGRDGNRLRRLPPARNPRLPFIFPGRDPIIKLLESKAAAPFPPCRRPRRARRGAMAMVANRAGRFIILAVPLVALAFAAARGQDPASAESSPLSVLKDHNLDRSGTTWILTSAEKNVLKDLADARALFQQVAEGMMRQQELEMGAEARKADILELRERSDILSQQIAAINQQLTNLVAPPSGNNFVNQQRTNLLSKTTSWWRNATR